MSSTDTVAVVAVSRRPGDSPVLEMLRLEPPTGHEVHVDIEAVGLCHADVAANAGDFPVGFPIVLGHEGCGRVRAVGPLVRDLNPGDRVVLSYDYCGRCIPCQAGRPTQCADYMAHNFPVKNHRVLGMTSDGMEVHGGFFGQSSLSTVAVANERNAIRVDTDLPSSWLAPLGCAIQTGFGAVKRVARPFPDDSVVIVGLGAVGFAALAAARSCGVTRTVAVDVDPGRLALATEFGATETIDASAGDWAEAVAVLLESMPDFVIDCSGSLLVLEPAVRAVRSGGTIVLVGAPPFGSSAPLDVSAVVNKSLKIVGTVEGDSRARETIPALVREIESNRFPIDRLINVRPFVDVPAILDGRGVGTEVIKQVLVMPH